MQNNDEIHVWEFPFQTTYLLLEQNYQRKQVEMAVEKYGSMDKLITYLNQASLEYGMRSRYRPAKVSDWKLGRMRDGQRVRIWIPLWICLELNKLNKSSEQDYQAGLETLEKNTLSYKGLETGTPITSPKLPIKVTPEFDSIVFHLMGDGCWGGKGKLSSYRQKNKRGRNQFIQKLHNVFGYFEINRFESELDWKVCIPSHLVRLIEKYYGLENPEFRKRVPEKIMAKDWRHKIAGLSAFIVDEGNVGDAIEIYASNKPLLEDLQEICIEQQYRSTVVLKASAGYRSHTIDHFRLRISLGSAEKLYQDISALAKDFPTCNLAQKQDKLEMIYRRQKLHLKKGENWVTKKRILEILSGGPKTVNELKEELLIGGQTIREHLQQLKQKEMIDRVGRIGNGEIWSLAQKSDSLD